MTESESHITVSRTSPDDVQQRQIIVELDGLPFSTCNLRLRTQCRDATFSAWTTPGTSANSNLISLPVSTQDSGR